MKRKWMLAVTVALTAALVGAGPSAAATLYVGDTEKYSVAFKAEGAQLYAMQFTGRAHCYFIEPYDNVGARTFNFLPGPKPMREEPEGFVTREAFSSVFGHVSGHLRATLLDDEVTGDYSYEEIEEGFRCDTGFRDRPFQASRYLPIARPDAEVPAEGEKRTYYVSDDAIEVFLRTTPRGGVGIRGRFVPTCLVGKGKAGSDRPPLFRLASFAAADERGRFLQRVVHRGRMRSGARYEETISLAGRIQPDAVLGSYRRVRTTEPGGQRCVTGPIPFRAVRYPPARS
jgi:hypothetical protein